VHAIKSANHPVEVNEMPVKHNLFEDLKYSKEDIAQRRQTDALLNSLLSEYDSVDAEVVQAEAAAAADDTVKKLKEKRLLVKDKIVQQLEYPGTRGAAKNF
jgi:uncharacterized protein YdcH (DUF465 family)